MNPADIPLAQRTVATSAVCQVDIEFLRSPGGATTVGRQRVGYPFHLGRSLRLAGDPDGMSTVYLQSCSGGMFEGDDLLQRIVVGPNAFAHVASAASTIVHGMKAGEACQRVEVDVQAGALLEYLPDPIILFPTARLRNSVTVRTDPTATVIIGDAWISHDPQADGGVFDMLETETMVHDLDGRLLLCDRLRIEGHDVSRKLPGINGQYSCQGTMFLVSAVCPASLMVAQLRQVVAALPGVYADASALPQRAGAWTRVLATDAVALRVALRNAWAAARTLATGQSPGERRK